jgi:hypothetical protein
MTSFVLVHSPSAGPATWAGVAGRLRKSGHGVAVPSLLGVAISDLAGIAEPSPMTRQTVNLAAVTSSIGQSGLAWTKPDWQPQHGDAHTPADMVGNLVAKVAVGHHAELLIWAREAAASSGSQRRPGRRPLAG